MKTFDDDLEQSGLDITEADVPYLRRNKLKSNKLNVYELVLKAPGTGPLERDSLHSLCHLLRNELPVFVPGVEVYPLASSYGVALITKTYIPVLRFRRYILRAGQSILLEYTDVPDAVPGKCHDWLSHDLAGAMDIIVSIFDTVDLDTEFKRVDLY